VLFRASFAGSPIHPLCVLLIGIRVVLFIKGLIARRDRSKGKGKVTDKKEKEIPSNETPKGETVDSGSSKKKKDEKKCIKKIVYYDNDASSSSPREDGDSSSTKKKTLKQNYSKTSFNYSRIPYNSNAHLLYIPLGKPLILMGKIIR
jgi:hypothetical protein